MTPAAQLRHLMQADRIVIAPGVYDGLSARIAAAAGFSALYCSGGAVARSTGVPDLGLLSMTEVLARLREVVDASSLPVIADADTGYGNAVNVVRTVREFERVGAAAIHLEDQVSPKKCGHYAGQELISAEEMVQKLRAALDARRDMLIIARTDARGRAGLDEALRRARLYAETGVDLVFVEAPVSREEIATIAREVPAPLLINMFEGGRTPLMPADELSRLGYRVMIVPSDLQRAAIKAMQVVAAALVRDGSSAAVRDQLASFAEREEVVDLESWTNLEARYAHG
ncbi:MAG: isocitrate lyase/PEP mutase family protein [Chloroflexi bacterium]|nr:isocitrate lyase/PEP mutase family protein [Chloroflexota bacterium]MBV9894408.1 isocitrate lyase/PEP mutase family protein [Chloroflexota bacterium]